MRRIGFFIICMWFSLASVFLAGGQEENRRNDEGGKGPRNYRYPPEELPLAAASGARLLPMDKDIGELSDTSSLEGEKRRVLERSKRFLDSLFEGRIESELLDPRSREALLLYLEPVAVHFPREGKIYYGVPSIGTAEGKRISARISFRLVEVGRSENETGTKGIEKNEAEGSEQGGEKSAKPMGEEVSVGELTFVWNGKKWYIVTARIPPEKEGGENG